jgi:hypothetical protein
LKISAEQLLDDAVMRRRASNLLLASSTWPDGGDAWLVARVHDEGFAVDADNRPRAKLGLSPHAHIGKSRPDY